MNDLEKKLIDHEGLKLKPYKCSQGYLTIGVGRNIQERGISEEEALYLMRNDIKAAEKELNQLPWYSGLDRVRQEVLIELHFNMGWPKLQKFKKTLGHMQNKDFNNAAIELLNSLWSKQVQKSRIDSIIYRLKNGKYQ